MEKVAHERDDDLEAEVLAEEEGAMLDIEEKRGCHTEAEFLLTKKQERYLANKYIPETIDLDHFLGVLVAKDRAGICGGSLLQMSY